MAEEEREATMADVKRIIRSKLRKHEEHEHHGLNIYPMMDMMTILLVFMVMQFASSSAAVVQQSEELRIPVSTSRVALDEAAAVQISRSEIVVDGNSVVQLRDGRVDPSDKQGGENGFLITPLYREMQRVRDIEKALAAGMPDREFEGNLEIIADKRTPFRTLTEVLYTVGQAEYPNIRFVVNSDAGSGGGGG